MTDEDPEGTVARWRETARASRAAGDLADAERWEAAARDVEAMHAQIDATRRRIDKTEADYRRIDDVSGRIGQSVGTGAAVGCLRLVVLTILVVGPVVITRIRTLF